MVSPMEKPSVGEILAMGLCQICNQVETLSHTKRDDLEKVPKGKKQNSGKLVDSHHTVWGRTSAKSKSNACPV
jgi:hypothetical protein